MNITDSLGETTNDNCTALHDIYPQALGLIFISTIAIFKTGYDVQAEPDNTGLGDDGSMRMEVGRRGRDYMVIVT